MQDQHQNQEQLQEQVQEQEQESQESSQEQGQEQKQTQAEVIAQQILEQLQKQTTVQKPKEEEDVEKILQELLKTQQPVQPPSETELEEIAQDPKKLVDFILQQVRDVYVQPLLIRMEQQRVNEEIRECQQKFKDFDEHRDEVIKFAILHPTVSIEQAYYAVTGAKKSSSKSNVVSVSEYKQKVQQQPHSEKPSVGRQSMRETPKTLQDAAAKAIREILGDTVE